MSYVPVNLWVEDTTDGPVVDAVNLKACDTCKALIPIELMNAHVAEAHPTLSVNPL
jgi:hypothetical protein